MKCIMNFAFTLSMYCKCYLKKTIAFYIINGKIGFIIPTNINLKILIMIKVFRFLFMTLLFFIATNLTISAQEKTDESEMQTLFGNSKFTFGGMGGPQIGISKFNSKDILLVGGRGGVVINHCLVLGGGGWGIVNMPKFNNIGGNLAGYLEGGYGGFLIEPIFMSKKLVHLSMPIMIGAGALVYVKDKNHTSDEPLNEIDTDTFFVFEPGVEAELNVVRFMRIAAGVRYRFAPNIDMVDTPSNPFNGLTASLTIKFGKF